MNSGKELCQQICIKVLVELHDPENLQLGTHLKGFAKVLRVLLHSIHVDGAYINIEILLGLDHIKIDGKLKAVLEQAVDQSGILVFLIGVAETLCQNSLAVILVTVFPFGLLADLFDC